MSRWSILAIIAWLAGLAGAVLVIMGTRFSSDMSAFLPRHPSPGQQVLVDQIQNGIASRLILAAVPCHRSHNQRQIRRLIRGRLASTGRRRHP